MSRTPLIKSEDKLDIVEHINQDHPEELLVIANYYGGKSAYVPFETALIKDIYEEGLLIEATHDQGVEELYIPFTIKGTIEGKILYLAYYALSKQGINLQSNRRKFFEVVDKSMSSKNMLRIYIRSTTPLPEYYAGYTYGIILKIIDSPPQKEPSENSKKGLVLRSFDKLLVWMLRVLNAKNRMKLVKTLNKDLRLYTLRHSEEDRDGSLTLGSIDVFLHGGSAGGNWIKSLKQGDIIFSRTEVEDRHQHLAEGVNVLIADETAYPAVAGILELWTNPTPPIVIVLHTDKADLTYFDDLKQPLGTVYYHARYQGAEQAKPVLDVLRSIEHLDGAWGGLEREEAKAVRHYVRNEFGVEGRKNYIKGYWAIKAEEEL
ncbi:Siderophore-interacting protein [Oligella ureolytica]|uniref:siderophore-interacting protein n=1 Tax=Oligella ureolytica TaxID=90244 RepID=UPI000E03A2E2|nr:siderophore-interacting protein [Oligella ureolytica]SUA54748.1 Siderophore-interacting protein [Oligella ureolytica]